MIFSFVRPSGNEIVEAHAFPAEMAERVKKAVQLLARGQMHAPSETVISVSVAGQSLNIPYRVYYDKQQLVNSISGSDDLALISLCLGTRHYDGFLREQCLRRLLKADEHWTAAFIIQLLGEYVLEVIQPIQERFAAGLEGKYLGFVAENRKYCEYLERRAISHWNEYYRARFPKYKDYPAIRALTTLRAATRAESK